MLAGAVVVGRCLHVGTLADEMRNDKRHGARDDSMPADGTRFRGSHTFAHGGPSACSAISLMRKRVTVMVHPPAGLSTCRPASVIRSFVMLTVRKATLARLLRGSSTGEGWEHAQRRAADARTGRLIEVGARWALGPFSAASGS
jgi:hypothetical protein